MVFLTYHMEETGNSLVACELLKSSMWLLSWEEEETSEVLVQVAIAPLAKNCSSEEPPREIAVGKQSTEACMEPTVAEHPSGQHLGKCCPQPPSSLHHSTVGTVFTLKRSETDGNFISPGMHMPFESSVSCFLCSLTFLSCPTHALACSISGKRLSCVRLAWCLTKPAFQI